MYATWNLSREVPETPEERPASGAGALDALIVEIAGQRYGLPAAMVGELLRAAAIAPYVDAPAIEGLLNLHGAVLPVFDLRALLRLPHKPIESSDQFIVIGFDSRRVLVRADRTVDLVRFSPEELERPGIGFPGGDCVARIARRPGELVPILDLETILTRAWMAAPKRGAATHEQASGKETLV